MTQTKFQPAKPAGRIDGPSREAIRASLIDDPYLFAKVVCGHRELSSRFHRPLAYLLAGCTDKLISLLNDSSLDDAFVIKALRRSIRDIHGIDWRAPDGRNQLDRLLRFSNTRMYRGSGKSSVLHATVLWHATRDPNETILICSGAEERAISFVKQIRKVIVSDAYRELFPERVPMADLATSLTEKKITLAGRTNPSPQATIEAWGYASNNVGAHYNRFILDDLVGPENSSPVELSKVHKYLADMVGLFTPGLDRPVTRCHVGTRYDEQDDSAELEKNSNCLSLIAPVEAYDGLIDDISVRGVPSNPDWHPVEAVQERFDSIVTDPSEGPASWRRNFLLDPSAGGGRIFPSAIVDGADWTPYYEPLSKRTWVSRIERDPVTREQLKDKAGKPRWLRLDPQSLYVVIGVDQSFADDGDEWAVSVVGADRWAYKYQLSTLTGHGFDAMWDSILLLALQYKPRRIGLEKGAAQETTTLLKSRDSRFARIRGLIEGFPHRNEPKVFRIINNVAEPMKMGRYLLNPKDLATKSEMKLYKGPSSRAKDNILDSLAIANVLILSPPADAEWKRKWKMRPQAIAWLDTPAY